MTRIERLQPQFVEEIPRVLDPAVLYVSMEFATAVHLCCCGCGREVVTPLHPTRWRLSYDGEAVSLHPSVGSWSLPCRSHYVIRSGHVLWAADWSAAKVAAAQARDRADIEAFFAAEADDQHPRRARRDRLPPRAQTLCVGSGRG